MGVAGFDHYNLRAARPVLEELKAFYCDVVGLVVGERPPFRRFGYWLYAGGRPVLHLSEADDGEARSRTSVTTFAHAAFNCAGRAEFELRLRERGTRVGGRRGGALGGRRGGGGRWVTTWLSPEQSYRILCPAAVQGLA
jgi:catechol 2,3-dioxygenase-like lactoylglutathione lyase family enzyme